MPLNQAQLMAVPGGPGVTGSVKGSSTITVAADGSISTSAKSLLPTYVAGKYLYTDGTNLSWQDGGGGGGGITGLTNGTNISISAASGPIATVNVINSPNFSGKVTVGNGIEVTGGGIISEPGGSAADPGFKLSNPSGTFIGGLFLDVGSASIGLSTNGTMVFKASTTATEITKALTVSSGGITCTPGGSAATPGFRLQNPTGTETGGLYLQTGSNSIGLSYGGTSVLEASASQTTINRNLIVNAGQITIQNQGGGSAANPAFFIQSPSSPGTNNGGMYLNPSSNVLGLAWNGQQIIQGNGSLTTVFGDLTCQGKVTFQGGSFTSPGLRFASDTDTGIYQVGSGDNSQVGISCNATEVVYFKKNELRLADTVGIDAIFIYNNPLASTSKVVVNSQGVFGINSTALPYVSDSGASPYGLTEILQLQSTSFLSTIGGIPAAVPSIGLIANDVYNVMPLAVGMDQFGAPYTVDTDAVVATLVSAVQELNQNLVDLQTAFDDYVATHP